MLDKVMLFLDGPSSASFSFIFGLFKQQHTFYNKYKLIMIYQVCGARIQTLNLLLMSLLPHQTAFFLLFQSNFKKVKTPFQINIQIWKNLFEACPVNHDSDEVMVKGPSVDSAIDTVRSATSTSASFVKRDV